MGSENEDPNYQPPASSPGNADSSLLSKKATGPRTAQGKERSKGNATKHGIFSAIVVLPDESRDDFEALLLGLQKDFNPKGALEGTLVEKLATLFWRYRRVLNLERTEFPKPREVNFLESLNSTAPPPKFDQLVRYEISLDRSIDRTLTQIERFQRIRLGQPVLPAIKITVN
jgi:hypothetical protein